MRLRRSSDTNRLRELLDLDPTAIGQLEEDLIRARVFSVEVNGRPWFHEQRRRFVVERILKEDERAEASARAIGLLMDWGRADGSFDRMPEIARLLPDASGLLAETSNSPTRSRLTATSWLSQPD